MVTSAGPEPRLLQRRSTAEVERDLHDEDDSLTRLHLDSTPLDRPQEPSPRIKLTPWRYFNTFFILSVGVPKAVYAYQGLSTTPNTLDWILGVFWALTSYWFTVVEMERPNIWPWFFQREVELPLRVIMIVICIFASFFMFGIFAITLVASSQRTALSEDGGLITFLGDLIAPLVVTFVGFIIVPFLIFCTFLIGQRLSTSRPLHALARPWRTFLNLFSFEDWVIDISEDSILLWFIPFGVFFSIFFLLMLPKDSDELKMDVFTSRITILASTIFGVSGVLASVVTFGTMGGFRMGMRLVSGNGMNRRGS